LFDHSKPFTTVDKDSYEPKFYIPLFPEPAKNHTINPNQGRNK